MAMQVPTVFTLLLAFLVADAEGRHHAYDCPPFSCGHLRGVSSPFRRLGDPLECGVQSYELVCTDDKATIRIGRVTYNVVSINYSNFWVVEADWGVRSSCHLPRWDRHPYMNEFIGMPRHSIELAPYRATLATFVNCSQPIENNDRYKPVACLSTNSSFIYVMTSFLSSFSENFEPSCGYLAMTPLGGPGMIVPQNSSYLEVVTFMRKGFALLFPFMSSEGIGRCLAENMRVLREEPRNITGIKDGILNFFYD
ncbi:unnamed protein product [Urochloa humidicola]